MIFRWKRQSLGIQASVNFRKKLSADTAYRKLLSTLGKITGPCILTELRSTPGILLKVYW
jgi:hypothetical protein